MFFSLLTMLALLAGCAKDEPKGDVPVTCSDDYALAYDCDCDGVKNDVDPVPGCAVTDTGSEDTGGDTGATAEDLDGDTYDVSVDCDDGNAAVNPGAAETCNDRDDDCDGAIDEDAGSTWYEDVDADGYGDAAWSEISCTQPARFVANALDCDDLDAEISPAATETCDEVDNDCDGAIDDNPSDGEYFYRDADGDGWGIEDPDEESDIEWACEAPVGFVPLDGDCNDASTAYHPSASEIDCADPADYNCDGFTGAVDADRDGYYACQECDDGNAAVNPAAVELCDRIDNDCDERVDTTDAVDARAWRADADSDGYGDMAGDVYHSCTQPAGRVEDATDCNDRDPEINPDGTEVCDAAAELEDEWDEDCDGLVEDADPSVADQSNWYFDADGDGYGGNTLATPTCDEAVPLHVTNNDDCRDTNDQVYPGATEYANGIDDDCDTLIDEP